MAEDITSFIISPTLMKDLHVFPEIQTSLEDVANRIAERARAMAPVVTGNYRDGIQVNKPNSGSGVWRVYASDQKSSWVEFGNGKQPPQFIMRSACESLGFKMNASKGA